MKIVIVHIRVVAGREEEFIEATLQNASHSLKEPGISRFELLREESRPDRFVLFEAYRDAGAQAAHRETEHYKRWRDLVEPMMAEPRSRAEYGDIGAKIVLK
jgi:quinol monooxygenase YgiN